MAECQLNLAHGPVILSCGSHEDCRISCKSWRFGTAAEQVPRSMKHQRLNRSTQLELDFLPRRNPTNASMRRSDIDLSSPFVSPGLLTSLIIDISDLMTPFIP